METNYDPPELNGPQSVVPAFADALKSGQPIELPVYSVEHTRTPNTIHVEPKR